MTESDWTSGTDPSGMICWALHGASPRKRRLYLCAGCRRIEHLFYDPASLEAVEAVERHVDGRLDDKALDYTRWRAEPASWGVEFQADFFRKNKLNSLSDAVLRRLIASGAVTPSVLGDGPYEIDPILDRRMTAAAAIAEENSALDAARGGPFRLYGGAVSLQNRIAEIPEWPGRWLLHCVFGNPFHPAIVRPGWLRWHEGAVPRLARRIYEERAFDLMPRLGRTLARAGCGSRRMLAHCREEVPHARGCWVLDLILGHR